MTIELMGAKLITPYFGNSLSVWSSVIGITLLSLSGGYYFGNKLSLTKEIPKKLYYIFLAVSIIISCMPGFSLLLLKFFGSMEIVTGSLVVSLFILFPPLVLFGAVTPMIIQLLTKNINMTGRFSGLVYSISTLGGIFSTFLFGYLIIPYFGITKPLLFCSFLLLSFSILLFYKKIVLLPALFSFLLLISVSAFTLINKNPKRKSHYRIKMYSEGILGQLKVVDLTESVSNIPNRILFINGIPQTRIFNNWRAMSFWKYVHALSMFASLKPKGSESLLFGFGAGSVASELLRLGFKIDAVEIDVRMLSIAKNYFYFNDSTLNLIIDDARHFINTNLKKYDLIVFDLLSGEVQPSYVFTNQSFSRLKKMLKPDGIILIEFQELGIGLNAEVYKSIFQTLKENGYFVYTSPLPSTDVGDIIFIASLSEVNFNLLKIDRQNDCCTAQEWFPKLISHPVNLNDFNFPNSYVFDDNQPLLDNLNQKTVKYWRSKMIDNFMKHEILKGYGIVE